MPASKPQEDFVPSELSPLIDDLRLSAALLPMTPAYSELCLCTIETNMQKNFRVWLRCIIYEPEHFPEGTPLFTTGVKARLAAGILKIVSGNPPIFNEQGSKSNMSASWEAGWEPPSPFFAFLLIDAI